MEETALFNSEEFKLWNELWQARLRRQQESKDDSRQLMRNSNPAVIPRNHRVEESLEAAVEYGDYSVMKKLLDVLSNPYNYSQEKADFYKSPTETTQPFRTYCGT